MGTCSLGARWVARLRIAASSSQMLRLKIGCTHRDCVEAEVFESGSPEVCVQGVPDEQHLTVRTWLCRGVAWAVEGR